MTSPKKTYLNVKGRNVPVKIYREYRRNVRATIGKQAAILRLPSFLDKQQQSEQLQWFANWVKDQFEKKPDIRSRFFGKNYQSGDILTIGARKYSLVFEYTDLRTHNARLNNRVIHLRLSKSDTGVHLQKAIKHLLSRIIGQDFRQEIIRRVREINQLHFRQNIKSINLKYNQSNWGSCSAQGNVNLSTRLLFAPQDVIDYVIIHELAHLIELNHSKRFWKLVSDAMPDYKAKEKWLKEYGHLCQF